MNLRSMVLLLVCLSLSTYAQRLTARPSFNDFAVKSLYTGAPARPKLTRDQRRFRTMIRRGAKARVEFAGHYTVPTWGCGAGCTAFAIVDSRSGKVYNGFAIPELSGAYRDRHPETERIEFYPNSRLMKINGCPDVYLGVRLGDMGKCGLYDYVMEDGKGLKLIRKELLPKEPQYTE